jgi:hypothetical protein
MDMMNAALPFAALLLVVLYFMRRRFRLRAQDADV